MLVRAVSITTLISMIVAAAFPAGAQDQRAHADPVLHSFLDSAQVYPESVTVDPSSGTFFVGSVKEGTIYKGQVGKPRLEVLFKARNRPLCLFGSLRSRCPRLARCRERSKTN
jgi:hypothetical protein